MLVAPLLVATLSVLISVVKGQGGLLTDQGCPNERPARCPRPDPYETIDPLANCQADYSLCPIAQLCYNAEQTYQCSDGTCSKRFETCENKERECNNKGYTRCPDGYCRRDCKAVRYSSCPMDAPLLCPQGKCVKYVYQCSGGHYCDLSRPFLCPDMSCGVNLGNCSATQTGRTFLPFNVTYSPELARMQTKISRANIEFSVLYDSFNPPKFSPFETQKLPTGSMMLVEPVSLGQLRDITNRLNSTLAGVVKDFYMISEEDIPYQITIRSTAFKIQTIGRLDDNEYFKVPIIAEMSINSIRKIISSVSNLSNYICLGRVIEANKSWTCVSRNIRNEADFADRNEVATKLRYDIPGPGTYAVILRPRMTPELMKLSNCGLICQNKRLFVTFIFITLPIIFSMFYFCWKVYLLHRERIENEEMAQNARERLMQMETLTVDFKGQSLREKLEEGLQFKQNPLQSDLVKDLEEASKLQKTVERLCRDLDEIKQVKLTLYEKTRKHVKRIAKIKDDIRILGTNRYDREFNILHDPRK